MSLEKRWCLKPEPDPAAVSRLTHARSPTTLATLLAQRGISSPEEAKAFYHPTIGQLHDPFLMKDMDRAVERIERALMEKEPIMVYGDYDVDGTTAVALVYSVLSRCTGEIMHYIPDRYAEGYGISTLGIDRAAERGVKLIIALDCGIKSVDKVAYAKQQGIDFIICDHHLPGDALPDAVAVLDPKRPDCPYPFKELSGCGIGFKLMQAFMRNNDMPFSELEELLDLVAVSIGCDIVPVLGENRVLAYFGLERLNDSEPRPGIRTLLELSTFTRKLTITDLVFVLGPRINAAGRIEHGQQAVELLLAKSANEAANIGKRIDGNNTARQDLDRTITEEALDLFETDDVLRDAWSTVVYNADWHKGVVGIVASRLIERHYRPTVVLTESNGMASGSARSVKGFNVHDAIAACSDLLEQFGGHMYAAGLTLRTENIDAFRKRFEEVVRARLHPSMRIPEEEVDLAIGLAEIAPLIRGVEGMEPFGPGNMKPVFLTTGVQAREVRLLGTGGDHLKCIVHDARSPALEFEAIAFRQGDHFDLLRSGAPFSMVYTVEKNDWHNKVTTQLNIKDIKAGTRDVRDAGTAPSLERSPAAP